jgi:hypothetical protein
VNQRQLASVFFAVAGIFIAASHVSELLFHIGVIAQYAPGTETSSDALDATQISYLAIGAAVSTILIGVALVLLRNRLANRLFATGGESLEVHNAQAAALSVVGCYIFVQGISRLVATRGINGGGVPEIVLGVALFLGGRGLSGLWQRVRLAARPGL